MQKSDNNTESEILKGLNPAQAEAVKALNGPVLIIAGAGSGKTKVLTHRIANLIANGVNPYNILALTFTNKAAKEMKERISNLISYDKARQIWAGTFHSVFARILRSEADKIGYTSNFSIYDTDDSTSQIKQALATLGLTNQKFNANAIRGKISGLKNKLTSPTEFAGLAQSSDDRIIADIYKHYNSNLVKNNAMDFDDILTNMIVLLRSSQETLDKYHKLFKYLLIDEYQDTNKAQYIAINMLAKSHQNLCVVGDDAQSIYRWRGADIGNILDFNKNYPYSKVVRLEQNYRSTKTIISAAHNVIKNNHNQIPKTLWTDNPEGDLINIDQCADDREESFRISVIIQKEIKKGRQLKDIAVLYRTNAQSLSIENSLRSQNIPYIIIGGISFYKRKEIKDVLAYITLLANPSDNEAFIRAINEPPRGIGLTSLRNLRLYAEYNNLTLLKASENSDNIPEIKGKASIAARQFGEMVNKYRNLLSQSHLSLIIEDYLNECGILDMFREIGSDDSLDRINNINQLLTDMMTFLDDNEGSDLADYLQQISLVSDIDEKDLNGNNITLMTLHSAKGLEYPVVIIAGVESGLFPLERTRLNQEEEEEERRLFYVGVTRAKEKLYLTYAMRRARFGEISNNGPSKFIREVPRELTNLNQSTGMSAFPAKSHTMNSVPKAKPKIFNDSYSQIPADEDYSQIPVSNIPFRVGDKVKHNNFGRGRIISLSGAGSQEKAIVNFDSVGNKVMMLNYAKLERW